jgi:hypothetical protein
MKKFLSLLFTFILVNVFTMNAQSLTDSQMWWGYYTGSQKTQLMGDNKLETYDVGMFVAGDKELKGTKISGVRMQMRGSKSNYTNCTVWVRDSLNGANLAEKTVDAASGWVEGDFDTAIDMPSTGVYVGYSFTIASWYSDYDYTPVVYAAKVVRNGLWTRSSGGTNVWTNNSSKGCSTTQIIVSGGDLKGYAVGIDDNIPNVMALVNTIIPVSVDLTNLGTTGVNNIDYTYTIGSETKTGRWDLDVIDKVYGEKKTVDLKLVAPAKKGTYATKLTVTRVNGMDNENTESNSATFNIYALMKNAAKKTLVETYVGCSKSYSPRAIVGIKELKDSLGDKIIPVAIHKDDAMQIAEYKDRMATIYSLPTCQIDRTAWTDPYFGDSKSGPYHFTADKVVDKYTNAVCEASLEVNAQWADEAMTKINCSSNTIFFYNNDNASYKLAYLLVEDSLSGSDSKWWQTNYICYYKSSYPDDDMSEFRSASYTMKDMKHNDVVVAASNVNGISGSIPESISYGQLIMHNYEMPYTKISETACNPRIVVMLIDTENGKIVNANICKVANFPTSIKDINSNTDGNVDIYNINGQKVFSGKMNECQLNRGIYIVKNGNSARKITIR